MNILFNPINNVVKLDSYLLIFKLYPAYLFVLGACCAEDGLNICLYINGCINQAGCVGIKNSQRKNIGVLSLTLLPSPKEAV